MRTDFNFFSPRNVNALLEKEKIHLSKRYGQNFLLDHNIAHNIVESMRLEPSDRVLEIGPGIGTMTGLLLDKAREVVACEIDKGLVRIINGFYPDEPAFKLIHDDFLKTDLALLTKGGPMKVYSSLPYNCASQILIRLTTPDPGLFPEITVMLPDEIVARLRAASGDEAYGIMGVFMDTYYRIEDTGIRAGRNAFFPRPKVDSRVVRLLRKDSKDSPAGEPSNFMGFVSQAFRFRRKKAMPVLANIIEKEKVAFLFDKFDISPMARPEEIGPAVWREFYRSSAASGA